jgi:hypothetical protein
LSLILKEWSVTFDPTRDALSPSKVWVILPNLPLAFWREEVLKAIENRIGSFLSFEPGWESKVDRRWAWVHIEINMRLGLTEDIELVLGDFVHSQWIDYWHVSFRCFGFHEVGHVLANCHIRPVFFKEHAKL